MKIEILSGKDRSFSDSEKSMLVALASTREFDEEVQKIRRKVLNIPKDGLKVKEFPDYLEKNKDRAWQDAALIFRLTFGFPASWNISSAGILLCGIAWPPDSPVLLEPVGALEALDIKERDKAPGLKITVTEKMSLSRLYDLLNEGETKRELSRYLSHLPSPLKTGRNPQVAARLLELNREGFKGAKLVDEYNRRHGERSGYIEDYDLANKKMRRLLEPYLRTRKLMRLAKNITSKSRKPH